MASSSLIDLIKSHEENLTNLYSSLTLSPEPLVTSSLDSLRSVIALEINKQTSQVDQLVVEGRDKLDKGWNKVNDWLNALGEPRIDPSPPLGGRGGGVLEEMVKEVEGLLEGLRGRIEQRGRAIVRVQTELYELSDALGGGGGGGTIEIKLDERTKLQEERGWEDMDLRRERLEEFERERERCRNEIIRRQELINLSTSEIVTLYNELGGASLGDGDKDEEAWLEKVWLHLGIGGTDKQTRTELAPTLENLDRVQQKRLALEQEQVSRHETIQSTYDRLYPLWTMLGVSEIEMDQFVTQWSGSTLEVINAYQSELDRMLTLRRSNLSSFIDAERTLLTSLWDQLYLSHTERVARFPSFTIPVDPVRVWRDEGDGGGYEEELVNENVSEELLIRHEKERERCEREVEESRDVLDRLGKYFEVVQKGKDLEAAASDPSRLTARNSSTILLYEERDRKRVAREKPKLEAELRSIIPQWEAQYRRRFLVDGVPFLDSLDQIQRAEEMEKENKRRTKLGTTATGSSTTRPLRPQPTGSASSATVAPLKRQMTGASIKSSTSSTSSSTSIHPPPAKRQVPMTTGSSSNSSSHHHYSNQPPPSRPKSVLGDSSSRIANVRGGTSIMATPASTKFGASRSRSGTVSGRELATPTPATGGGSGMRIPTGWGGGGSLQPQPSGARALAPQRTGQFRPRPSTTLPTR